MKEKLNGSLDAMSALQVTRDLGGLDDACKTVLKNKEFLALILKYAVPEYKEYDPKTVMEFIESDISSSTEVSMGRTNMQLMGENVEFSSLNEKTSKFDIYFHAKNPRLSSEEIEINVYIDLEFQKDYRPGYPIEKRGIFYLARGLTSQLAPVVTEENDYKMLSKVYSIWICRDRIPKKEQYTLSRYEFVNTENTGMAEPKPKDYDLLSLIILRLGSKEYEEKNELFQLLNAIFYPNTKGSFEKITKFIDFSQNEQLKKEVLHMSGLGQSVLEEGIEQGIEQGIIGSIQILREIGFTEEQVTEKIVKQYHLSEEEANKFISTS